MENLKKIRENSRRDSSFNKKIFLWFYRMVAFAIEYKVLERDLGTIYVNE